MLRGVILELECNYLDGSGSISDTLSPKLKFFTDSARFYLNPLLFCLRKRSHIIYL